MLLPQSVIRITLDVREVEKQLSFAVKQNDSTRRLIVTLCDMGKPYVIGRGCYAVFSATTSANTTISNGCQIKNNEIIYDLSASDTAVVGRMDCDITLFGENGEVIAAPNFTINVYKSKMGEYAGEVVASNDFSTLQGLIGDVNERIAKVDAILESDGKTIDDAIEAGIETIDEHTEQQASAIDQKGEEVLAAIPADYTEISNATARHTAEIDILQSQVSINSKRLAKLEAGIPEEDFVEDNGVAYIKDVPVNAMPYAQINRIGGMTYKDGDTLKSAPVTKVESVGVNLFDKSKAENVTETDTGFEFTNADTAGVPINIGVLKNIAPEIKVGDTIYLSGTSLNSPYGNGKALFYLNGGKVDLVGIGIVVTDAILNGAVYAYGNQNQLCEYKDIVIAKISNVSYTPYVKHTLPIPGAVQAIEGYGQSNPDNAEEYNYIDLKNERFAAYGHLEGGGWRAYGSVQYTPIKLDGFIVVEGGGRLTFKNEHEFAVPSSVVYQVESEVNV